MSTPKYKIVINANDGENGVEITEGKYEGVIYTYGEVQFLPCLLYTSPSPRD